MKSSTEVDVSGSGGEHKSCKRRLVAASCTFVEAEYSDAFDEVIEAFTSGSVDDIMVDVAIDNAGLRTDCF